MQVGVHGCADGERRVEALAVGGKREHHRPPTARFAAQPGPAHLDAVLTGIAAAGDDPTVGIGDAGENVGLSHLPPGGGRDRVGQPTGEIG